MWSAIWVETLMGMGMQGSTVDAASAPPSTQLSVRTRVTHSTNSAGPPNNPGCQASGSGQCGVPESGG